MCLYSFVCGKNLISNLLNSENFKGQILKIRIKFFLQGFFAETKSPTLGLWLIFQIMTITVLSCLWAYFCYFVVIDHDSVVAGPIIQVPVAVCYFSRLLLVLLIWLKRRTYAREIVEPEVVPVPI